MSVRFLQKTSAILGICILSFAINGVAWAKAKYYRYTNSNGTPSISRIVTPEMIRLGYQELDGNMAFIRAVPPYNSSSDLKRGAQRASQVEQAKRDLQLRRAYHNVEYATRKKTESLANIQKQIDLHQKTIEKAQTERQKLYAQKATLLNSNKAVPTTLQQNMDNNEQTFKRANQALALLNTQYKQESQKYDQIIQRLRSIQ